MLARGLDPEAVATTTQKNPEKSLEEFIVHGSDLTKEETAHRFEVRTVRAQTGDPLFEVRIHYWWMSDFKKLCVMSFFTSFRLL